MQVTRSSSATGKGPADWFTGNVYLDTIAEVAAPWRTSAAIVHFTPHVAMQEADETGSVVTWGRHVTDEEYGAPRAS